MFNKFRVSSAYSRARMWASGSRLTSLWALLVRSQIVCARVLVWHTRRAYHACTMHFICAMFFACMTCLWTANASANRVRVVGRSQLEIGAHRSGKLTVISGIVRGDDGAPLRGAVVQVSVVRNVAAAETRSVGSATTSSGGGWTIEMDVPLGIYTVTAEVAATDGFEASRTSVEVDLNRGTVWLQFDDNERVLRLDDEQLLVSVRALEPVAIAGAAERRGVPDLQLLLQDERGQTIAKATTNAAGQATFHALCTGMTPGEGELRIAFEGTQVLGPSRQTRRVSRVARVRLVAVAPESASNPENGIDLQVTPTWAHGSGVRGTVEAYAGSLLVGAAAIAPVGSTSLRVKFGAPDAPQQIPLRVHFRATESGFEPGADARITLAVRGPSAWRHAPLLLAIAGVVAWMVVGRLRRAPVASPTAMPRIPERAAVRILRPLRSGAGYTGVVRDGHDGQPLPFMRVRILACSFEGESELASAVTNDDGRFELPQHPSQLDAAKAGVRLELVAGAALYAEHRQVLPAPADLEVFLITRRRSVLARFVAWARARYPQAAAEPAPLAVAAQASDNDAVVFATRVAEFVYSAATPTAEAEASTLATLPGPRAGQHKTSDTPQRAAEHADRGQARGVRAIADL
jgi:5-hydroxyisourate hydrolase-like protein (transthyretin family)